MVFIEVVDVDVHLEAFKKLNLIERFQNIKISEVPSNDWGDEYFVHDPAVVFILIHAFK